MKNNTERGAMRIGLVVATAAVGCWLLACGAEAPAVPGLDAGGLPADVGGTDAGSSGTDASAARDASINSADATSVPDAGELPKLLEIVSATATKEHKCGAADCFYDYTFSVKANFLGTADAVFRRTIECSSPSGMLTDGAETRVPSAFPSPTLMWTTRFSDLCSSLRLELAPISDAGVQYAPTASDVTVTK